MANGNSVSRAVTMLMPLPPSFCAAVYEIAYNDGAASEFWRATGDVRCGAGALTATLCSARRGPHVEALSARKPRSGSCSLGLKTVKWGWRSSQAGRAREAGRPRSSGLLARARRRQVDWERSEGVNRDAMQCAQTA